MGCCGGNKKKVKSQTDVIKNNKRSKSDKKIDEKEKKVVSKEEIDEKQPIKTEPLVQQEPIPIKDGEIPIVEKRTKSPSTSSSDYDIDEFIKDISPTDNISPVKTWHDLENSVQKNEKPVSIVLFYGRYCPYSKRTLPSLRQWARGNEDRIFLYEADVEQALDLAEYYHVRSIPTIMAFENKNLVAPIWQRTASNVLPSSSNDQSKTTENDEEFSKSNNLYAVLDPSFQTSDSSKETKPDQYFPIRDQMPNSEEEEEEEDKTIDQSHSLANVPSKSTTTSIQSPYIWNQSTQSLETTSEKSFLEYHGRMTSQSTLSSTDPWKSKLSSFLYKEKPQWNEHFLDNLKPKEYPQHIHLPNCNEIFYEKQFDTPHEPSSDRSSTLTYQQVQELNHPHEEICILYLGPNGDRGFEDNLGEKTVHPPKSSLLTLHSHLFK